MFCHGAMNVEEIGSGEYRLACDMREITGCFSWAMIPCIGSTVVAAISPGKIMGSLRICGNMR